MTIRQVRPFNDPRFGKLGSDIQSRMPAGHAYLTPGESMVNWAHETTHGINSRVRDAIAADGQVNAFYVGWGKAFALREPNVSLATVSRYVPPELRRAGFANYLLEQQRSWNRQPLYVLDEWSAYLNGNAVGRELGIAEKTSTARMIEFCAYAAALVQAVEAHDPSYPDRELLAEFVAYQLERSIDLAEHAACAGAITAEHEEILRAFFERYVQVAGGNETE